MSFTSISILYNCNYYRYCKMFWLCYSDMYTKYIFISFMKKGIKPFPRPHLKYLIDHYFFHIYFQKAVISCASSRSSCCFTSLPNVDQKCILIVKVVFYLFIYIPFRVKATWSYSKYTHWYIFQKNLDYFVFL